MKLRLYHGRNTPEQEMDDWGFEGATLFGVDGIIWTYGVPRVFFINDEYFNIAREVTGWDEIADGLEMRVYEDLIKTKQGCRWLSIPDKRWRRYHTVKNS